MEWSIQQLAKLAGTTSRALRHYDDRAAATVEHRRQRLPILRRRGTDPAAAYERGDAWWRGQSETEKLAWKQRTAKLGADWAAAAERGVASGSPEAQELAARHVEWVTAIPGTPNGNVKAYVIGLGEMYVADPRFGANYSTDGSDQGAAFVRDASRIYAEANL